MDLDGVLADVVPSIVKVLNKLGFDLPPNYINQDWGWTDAKLPPTALSRAWDSIKNTTNFWESLKPTSDIVSMAEFFWEKSNVVDIYFITARPETKGRTTRQQTTNWLREYMNFPQGDINVLVVDSGMYKAK